MPERKRRPRRKRKPEVTELPDKEAIRRLFPEEVVQEAERVAHERDDPDEDEATDGTTGSCS